MSNNEEYIKQLEEKIKILEEKFAKLEDIVENIKNDIYEEYEEDFEFEIVCPYCNKVFNSNIQTGVNSEIKCPECNNIIELDWNDDDCCNGHCSTCSGCSDDEETENDEDDDM